MHMSRKGFFLMIAALGGAGCAPGLSLPPVNAPLDSPAWEQCAGEAERREAVSLIDDATLDEPRLVCRGVTLAGAGKIDDGIDLLTEASVRDKKDHRPYYLAGRILAGAGRYEEALTAFEKSARRYPEMEVPTERLGREVQAKDGDAAALAFVSKADGRGLCPYGCLGLLAELCHRNGDDAKAKAVYEKMAAADPAEPQAFVGLAGLSNVAGDWAGEAARLDEAVAAAHFQDLGAPARADILYSLAFARYNAGDAKGAVDAIDRSLALDGGRADRWVLAGWIQMKREDPAVALVKFEKAAAMDPKLAAAQAGRGDASLALGQRADAIAAYEAEAALDPKSAATLLKLAKAKALDKQLDAARALFDQAVALDKEHLPAELVKEVSALVAAPAAPAKAP
jgi:tetratricopeptide (TPR) repeat protein